MAGGGLDLEALHCVLWNQAADDDSIRFEQAEFADELGTSRFALNRALQALVEDGRLVRISRSGNGKTQMYVVTDPEGDHEAVADVDDA
jgi:DNA-binding HxlR family transcriptional regulator